MEPQPGPVHSDVNPTSWGGPEGAAALSESLADSRRSAPTYGPVDRICAETVKRHRAEAAVMAPLSYGPATVPSSARPTMATPSYFFKGVAGHAGIFAPPAPRAEAGTHLLDGGLR